MTTSSINHLPTARYRLPGNGRAVVAVLRATLAELDDRGYAAASLQTIAARADVPLEAVFAEWRSKHQLVSDAIHHLAEAQPTPETGDLRTDLLQVVEALVGLLTHAGTAQVLRSLLHDDDGDSIAGPSRVGLLGERRAAIRRIVERGQRRQQLPTSVHPGVVADAVIGALVYRVLLADESVDRHTAKQIVDVVVSAHPTADRSR